ncbi:MAG TPA: PIG-L family deacetylase [Mycobacteriales bacterium]|nr:PIG-L family deacetylase [Mycobacteriales bacterium]
MTERPLTLMAVHAHPDDEASTTGGVLAKYSAEGIRTVLVTCTNGELGDTPGGKPGDETHDTTAAVALRLAELEESCRVLGVSHLELLGYHDSGMMGWETNDASGSFWSMPVEEAAAPLVELLRRYEPDVVVTYDDFGFYGHPDHIQAHRITMSALKTTGSTAKVYFPTFRRSDLPRFRKTLEEAGLELPDIDEGSFGVADEEVGATIDCREHAPAKLAALAAHVSQQENIFFLRLPMERFVEGFGTEEFVRERPSGGPVETDLFAGLRGSSG